VRRKPVITPVLSPISHAPRLFPTSDQRSFLRFLRNLFSSSSDADVVRTNEPRNPLDVCCCAYFTFAVDSAVSLQFPATSPLPRSHIKPDENVSEDFHYCIFNLHSSSLDHFPPNHPSSILPQPSNPAHIDYQIGGLSDIASYR
jgi:hypothetical protein